MRREGVFGINERVPDVSHPNPFRTRRFLRGVRTTIRLELVLGLKSGLWSELESTKRLGAKGLGYGCLEAKYASAWVRNLLTSHDPINATALGHWLVVVLIMEA